MNADLSMIHLIGNASLLVQFVMLLLLAASVLSWALIYHKWRSLASARREALQFEDRFWSGGDVGTLYKGLQSRRDSLRGLEHIFDAGFAEYARLHRQNSSSEHILAGSHRSMRVVLSRETDAVESNLSFLATVG